MAQQDSLHLDSLKEELSATRLRLTIAEQRANDLEIEVIEVKKENALLKEQISSLKTTEKSIRELEAELARKNALLANASGHYAELIRLKDRLPLLERQVEEMIAASSSNDLPLEQQAANAVDDEEVEESSTLQLSSAREENGRLKEALERISEDYALLEAKFHEKEEELERRVELVKEIVETERDKSEALSVALEQKKEQCELLQEKVKDLYCHIREWSEAYDVAVKSLDSEMARTKHFASAMLHVRMELSEAKRAEELALGELAKARSRQETLPFNDGWQVDLGGGGKERRALIHEWMTKTPTPTAAREKR